MSNQDDSISRFPVASLRDLSCASLVDARRTVHPSPIAGTIQLRSLSALIPAFSPRRRRSVVRRWIMFTVQSVSNVSPNGLPLPGGEGGVRANLDIQLDRSVI